MPGDPPLYTFRGTFLIGLADSMVQRTGWTD